MTTEEKGKCAKNNLILLGVFFLGKKNRTTLAAKEGERGDALLCKKIPGLTQV